MDDDTLKMRYDALTLSLVWLLRIHGPEFLVEGAEDILTAPEDAWRKEERACPKCAAVFTPIAKNQIYCCKEHQVNAQSARHHAKHRKALRHAISDATREPTKRRKRRKLRPMGGIVLTIYQLLLAGPYTMAALKAATGLDAGTIRNKVSAVRKYGKRGTPRYMVESPNDNPERVYRLKVIG